MKPTISTLEACTTAGDLLKRAGFELRYVSRKTEATYYGFPGRTDLIRVSAHASRRPRPMPWVGTIVARVTFVGTCLSRPGEMRLHPDKLFQMVALAIGSYFLKASSHGPQENLQATEAPPGQAEPGGRDSSPQAAQRPNGLNPEKARAEEPRLLGKLAAESAGPGLDFVGAESGRAS